MTSFFPREQSDVHVEAQSGELGHCEATSQPPDVGIHVADLASTFNGHVSFRHLAEANQLEVGNAAAVVALDKAFASLSAPYCSLLIV